MIQIPLIFLWIFKEYGSLPHRDILIQSSGYLRSVLWLLAYPVDWSKMCFSSMGLSIVRKDMIVNEVEIWRYSNFKVKPYENSKVKFIWETQNTPKYMGRDFTKTVDRTSLEIYLDLKTLPSIGQWRYFRTQGPGSSRTFELHYLAITRQVH